MKNLITACFAFSSLAMSAFTFADDDFYRLSNDLSYLDGSIDTAQHIYYPGDNIDIRVTMRGNTQVLADQMVDLYLGIMTTTGKFSLMPIKGAVDASGKRLISVQNISSAVLVEGTYQLALIATVPGGNPNNVEDWYNGFGGLLDEDAILYSETAIARDYDQDGEWDDDYDRDGFYGDDDDVYEHYYTSEGTHYERDRDWTWDDRDNDDDGYEDDDRSDDSRRDNDDDDSDEDNDSDND